MKYDANDKETRKQLEEIIKFMEQRNWTFGDITDALIAQKTLEMCTGYERIGR